MIKDALGAAADTAAFSWFVSLLERAAGEQPDRLRVLTYHRVDYPDARPDLCPDLISATPEAFEQQMQFLAGCYHPISAAELLERRQHGGALSPRSVLVTFDDAYGCFAEHAWPTLKRYRVPVILFVPTAFPDQPQRAFWWDRLHQALASPSPASGVVTPVGRLAWRTAASRRVVYKRLRDYVKTLAHADAIAWVDRFCEERRAHAPRPYVLSWAALRALDRAGVTLGAHTQNHPLLDRVSLAAAQAEIAGSQADLAREVGGCSPFFAYPSGHGNEQLKGLLPAQGIRAAFSTLAGTNACSQADWLDLRRINISRRVSVPVLRARLLA